MSDSELSASTDLLGRAPERMKFADVCALMPEGVSWGEHLTPSIARDLIQAGVAAERERWEKAARAALEVMDDLPTWSNAGHACNLLRECLAPNAKGEL